MSALAGIRDYDPLRVEESVVPLVAAVKLGKTLSRYDEAKHPRGRRGKWVMVLGRSVHVNKREYNRGTPHEAFIQDHLPDIAGTAHQIHVFKTAPMEAKMAYQRARSEALAAANTKTFEAKAKRALALLQNVKTAPRVREATDDPLFIEERALNAIYFDPSLHPRNRQGEFASVLSRLDRHVEMHLPHGITVKRGRVGGFRVSQPGRGHFHSTDGQAAVHHALSLHDAHVNRRAESVMTPGEADRLGLWSPGGQRPEDFKVGDMVRQKGYADPFRVTGHWRGNVALEHPRTGTTHHALPSDLSPAASYDALLDTSPERLARERADRVLAQRRRARAAVTGQRVSPDPLSNSSRERGLAQIELERGANRLRPRIRPEDRAAYAERGRVSKAQALVDSGLADDLADARAQLADMGETGMASPGGTHPLHDAFHDQVGGRVYWSSFDGNYHYKKAGGKPGGPVPPWNDAVKAEFGNDQQGGVAFRAAANEYIRPIALPMASPGGEREPLGQRIKRSLALMPVTQDADAETKAAHRALRKEFGMNPDIYSRGDAPVDHPVRDPGEDASDLFNRGMASPGGERVGRSGATVWKGDRLEGLRQIVARRQAHEIDGYLVDMQTANLLLKAHDALSPQNKERFGSVSMSRLASLAWSLAR